MSSNVNVESVIFEDRRRNRDDFQGQEKRASDQVRFDSRPWWLKVNYLQSEISAP
jgi:hypothetical protein